MESRPQPRTYGGWRRSRGMGLMGLGPFQTLLVLGAVTLLVIAATVSFTALAVLAAPCLLLLAGVLARYDGVPLAYGVVVRLRWWYATTRGHTSYRAGVMVAGDHAWGLPGVLAPTQLLSIADPGGDFGVVHNPRTATFTVTLRCAATSTWLADPDEGAAWVGSWGGWLANLGHQPGIAYVAVTVDSAPDPGTRLADHMSRRIIPAAPASAVRILRQLIDTAPAAAADVQTRMSITFHYPPPVGRPSDPGEALDHIARALPGLTDALGTCGLAVLGRATAADLIGIVRTAFDPAMRGDVDRMLHLRGGLDLARWLDWDSAGPVMAEERVDRYIHDSGVSVTWAWHEAPRQQVHADVLSRLVAPGPYPKRVTLLYRPLPAAEAARTVEQEVNAAAFRASLNRVQRRDESARDATDRERAQRAAWEEATGAGIGFMSLFVTVTVTDQADLPRAVADVESRAGVAKIRLRKLLASQSSGFATTLPCGAFPPAMSRIWPR
jgi:hypothetical protein